MCNSVIQGTQAVLLSWIGNWKYYHFSVTIKTTSETNKGYFYFISYNNFMATHKWCTIDAMYEGTSKS